MLKNNDVWLITGCSSGLGRALAEETLKAGYRVVATARTASALTNLVSTHGDAVLAVALDVTKPDQIASAISAAEDRFGCIDVLVNNAGYGYFGAIEEGEGAGVHAMFETNVFGPGTWRRRRFRACASASAATSSISARSAGWLPILL